MADLENVTWADFKIGDLFEVSTSKGIDKTKVNINEKSGTFDFIGRTTINNGVQGYLEKLDFEPNKKDTFSVIQIGENVAQFRKREWYSSQNIFLLSPNNSSIVKNKLFILTVLNKTLTKYSGGYSSYPTKEKLKNDKITLPVLANGDPDYDFMEEFIKELEHEQFTELDNFLQSTGLSDTKLTKSEQKALDGFESLTWGDFKLDVLFDTFKQGKRLKRADQKSGNLPYIMAGVTDQGIANYVSNARETYPKNSITIDTLGNVFYRSYDYGAGDDTGMLWSKSKNYPKQTMLFIANCIQYSIKGKYSYSYRIRSSNFSNIVIKLPLDLSDPTKPDYQYMETFINAIEKQTMKDVVNKKTNK